MHMTGKDKQSLYTLVRLGATMVYGYTPPALMPITVEFKDDINPPNTTPSIASITSIPPNTTPSIASTDNIEKTATIVNENSASPIPTTNGSDIYNLVRLCATMVRGYVPPNFPPYVAIDYSQSHTIHTAPKNTVTNEAIMVPTSTPLTRERLPRTLDDLYKAIKGCKGCPLSPTPGNRVLGIGARNPLVLIVLDPPNIEDTVPISGESAALLEKMFRAIHLERDKHYYITNVAFCHGTTPLVSSSLDTCKKYLTVLARILKPRVIVTMGTISSYMLRGNVTVSVDGDTIPWQSIPVMAITAPNVLIAQPSLKRAAWESLKKLSILLTSKEH